MIPPPFRYLKPASVEDALTLLADHPGSAVLSGGQTMINALKLDLVAPSALIDVHRLPELRGVAEHAEALRIGAAVTYAELAGDPVVTLRTPELARVTSALVDRQVRNRGTVGGNCSLNDPTSNLPPLLAALGATFEVRVSGSGTRMLPAEEFFVGSLLTQARHPNLLVAVHVPVTASGTRVSYRHQQVGADSWAIARAVVRADFTTSGTVELARVVLGAVPGSPLRLPQVEEALAGGELGPAAVEAALRAFDAGDVETLGDSHGSAVYRLGMARVQLKRALGDVCESGIANKEVA